MTTLFAQPTHLYLEIPSNISEDSWNQSLNYSHSNNNWRAYLNRICLECFISYLQEDYEFNVNIWQEKQLQNIWEFTNGSVITVEDKKIVLIPTEAIDDEELRVSQEWVDIPSWIADYYVAIQVNLDEEYIRIKGYTSHQQLKTKANYDATDKSYSLSGEELINDISILWAAQELGYQENTQEALQPLETISETKAENLIKRLGNPQIMFPRLSIPFVLWGSLLENQKWLEKLCNLRHGKAENSSAINLSSWLNNLFDNVWQSPESLNLAFNIARSVQTKTTEVKRARLINLDFLPENKSVILLLTVTQETDGRIGIFCQLCPHQDNRYLPENLQLQLLSEEDQILKSSQASSKDKLILIPRFKCNSGFGFKIKIELDEFSYTSYFIV